MTRFFADAFYWIALANPGDSAHREVMAFTEQLPAGSVVTTEETLTELLNFCSAYPQLRREVGQAVEGLQANSDIRIIPQSAASFREGLAALQRSCRQGLQSHRLHLDADDEARGNRRRVDE